jgi:hypothetical protein
MGTWGYAVFADDTALDVRAIYRELILTEPDIEDTEATRRVLGDYPDQEDPGTVAWLALALSQYELGRLDPAVAERAIQIIDSGADVAIWEADERGRTFARRRRAVLARLRTKLTGPQPPRRRVAGGARRAVPDRGV